ncbi:DUF899 family protein [Oceanobacillus sojae]|uniref:DUF899 family protein n=1 Tax=Oceanobacillus sojae TaxID=582851 RepID=UPI0009887900
MQCFLRGDEDRIFLTYSTGARGVEHLGTNWSYLDITPFGRQEYWEDSPAWVPQTQPYLWIRLHDKYDKSEGESSCCNS